jgi:hypothetical protein
MNAYRRPSQPIPVDAVAAARTGIEREFAESGSEQMRLMGLALNEAEALAWQSGFPHLVFPVLAWEKVEAVTRWRQRQEAIRQGGLPLAFAA